MPEGDSLRKAAAMLTPVLEGHSLRRIWFRRQLEYMPRIGDQIKKVDACGKHLLIVFERDLVLDVHLGMTGRWRILPPDAEPTMSSKLRITLSTNAGHGLCYAAPTIRTSIVSPQHLFDSISVESSESASLEFRPTSHELTSSEFQSVSTLAPIESFLPAFAETPQIQPFALSKSDTSSAVSKGEIPSAAGKAGSSSATATTGKLFTAHLGPDLSDDEVNFDEIMKRSRAQNSDTLICDLLLDQSVAAGIGNVYKSEVLHINATNPFELIECLSDSKLLRLWNTAHQLLVRNRATKRRTTAGLGDTGLLYVYGRHKLGCRRCEYPISYSPAGLRSPRSSYWCAQCQPKTELNAG